MKIKAPLNRLKIVVSKNDYVLEVGGGHNPHPLADIIVDKYIDNNSHRSGNIRVGKNQIFMHADYQKICKKKF